MNLKALDGDVCSTYIIVNRLNIIPWMSYTVDIKYIVIRQEIGLIIILYCYF